ncbi:MAG: hypothetical protein V1647_05975, partial [Pseudomonadota bacterium]
MKIFLLASLVWVSGNIFATVGAAQQDGASWCSKITYYYSDVAYVDLDRETAKNVCDFCSGSELGNYQEDCSRITCISGAVWIIGEDNVSLIRKNCEKVLAATNSDSEDSFWYSFTKALGNVRLDRHR